MLIKALEFLPSRVLVIIECPLHNSFSLKLVGFNCGVWTDLLSSLDGATATVMAKTNQPSFVSIQLYTCDIDSPLDILIV